MFSINPPLFLIFSFILGAVLGSFGNVVIHRWPLGESVVRPRSRCPSCHKSIAWYDNIPILSWLLLRGRCRNCQARISFRYPLVEIIMGTLFLAVTARYEVGITLIEYYLFVFGIVICSFIDLKHYLLPDVFTLSGIVIGLLGSLINPDRDFLSAFIGVLIGGGFLWAIAYFYFAFRKQEGMGGGDIKLLGWIGAVLGWKAIPFVIFGSSIVASAFGLVISFRKKQGMKTALPFGPFLGGAALFLILGGDQLALRYLRLFLPFVE